MARHNRDGRGSDQRGFDYAIGYQPDWLRVIKVTRDLESGRQSTKTLFRNPDLPEQEPGPRTRTHVRSPEQGLDFEVAITDPAGSVRSVVVKVNVPGRSPGSEETIVFTLGAGDPAVDE